MKNEQLKMKNGKWSFKRYMWVCWHPTIGCGFFTLKRKKCESIKAFLDGDDAKMWLHYKQNGWGCIRVEMVLTEV